MIDSKSDILPDSRAKTVLTPKGMVQGPGGMWVPVFCANCGHDGGLVPEQNMTFIFYLCNKCAATHGPIAGTMMMPDEVFFEALKNEQLESHGRYLNEQELHQVLEAGASPLSTLLNSRR